MSTLHIQKNWLIIIPRHFPQSSESSDKILWASYRTHMGTIRELCGNMFYDVVIWMDYIRMKYTKMCNARKVSFELSYSSSKRRDCNCDTNTYDNNILRPTFACLRLFIGVGMIQFSENRSPEVSM